MRIPLLAAAVAVPTLQGCASDGTTPPMAEAARFRIVHDLSVSFPCR